MHPELTTTGKTCQNWRLFEDAIKTQTVFFMHFRVIEQLKLTVKNQEDLIQQKSSRDPPTDSASTKELSDLIAEKDQQLQV